MKLDFEHRQSAHCENGVISNLVNFYGSSKITEPLAFGIGSGLFYIYIPFLKVNGCPAMSYRILPGLIFKRTCTALGISYEKRTFSDSHVAQQELDKYLLQGKPVGCQVGVYYLTYFPKEYRFHFNAHNIVVYGKEEDRYLISDPVMETTTSLTASELDKVRFAKGALAPKGKIYYPVLESDISDDQIRKAIIKGIKRNVRDMLYIPGNIAGVSGIEFMAKKILKWYYTLGIKTTGTYLAQMVRMQEEIGTGGGGFRFIYAAFLQEAYAYIPKEELLACSEQFTKAGDLWRNFAVNAAGVYKGRLQSEQDIIMLAQNLREIAEIEKSACKALKSIKW